MQHWFSSIAPIDFDAPRYLLLVVLLPLFWFVARRTLQALSPWRRRAALLLRMVVATLLIVALAEPNWRTIVDRLTVLFVVDASDSIQPTELQSALAYVNAAAGQRNDDRGDRAGVVVFGRASALEIPPVDHSWHLDRIESELDPRFTNLEAALQQASAAFPPGTAKRLVLVSDGNENLGLAAPQADRLLDAGVGIDYVPIRYERVGDVRVDKVDVPSDVRRSTPFQLRVVMENLARDTTVSGKLRVIRSIAGDEQLVTEEDVVLEPGKRVFTVRQELTESGMATYQARFVPDDPSMDSHIENNVATGFSHVSGQGRVLLIEDAALPGRFDTLVDLLRRNEIEVTVRDTRRPFDNLADLQQFDAVILADAARVAGEGADITQFSDEQINDLVQNTRHFGCGLLVLGGPNSYGAGGWTNTELEKALPVNFQIESAKVDVVGALVLVIDSSGSMTGEKIAWSKAAAAAAAKMLSRRDYIGIIAFDSSSRWVVPLQRNGTGDRTRARIGRLSAGGGTDMMPALREAYRAIQGVDASLKHVIALTDGQTPPDNFSTLVAGMRQRGITTSGVAVGQDADRALLADISTRGGGKFYHVLSPRAIPRIFMREARRVAMPLIYENAGGIPLNQVGSSEMLSGISAPPPVTGYVLTTVKQDPLVEVLWATPRQPAPNSTLLATWQYGLGRAVALTTDIGERWATDWQAWGDYEKWMLQLVRWTMRSHDWDSRLALTTDVRDGQIHVVINALDLDDTHLNYMRLFGTVVPPEGEPRNFTVEQVAPGRYAAAVAAESPGNYYFSISGGDRSAPLRAAVEVSSSREYESLASRHETLIQFAHGKPTNGQPGSVIDSPAGIADTETLLETNVFRDGLPPAINRQSMWPVVLLVACLVFLSDVFCRRVQISWQWLAPFVARWTHRRAPAAETEAAERLQRLKQTKTGATARFATQHELETGDPLAEVTSTPAPPDAPVAAAPASADEEPERADYTSRLLEAKRRARAEQRPK